MVKTPRLLIELYEIASQKEKIEYIQAAKGYSGLYLKGVKDPTYVTLRLRGIKQYFNDNVLLHIHRSYLVNPNKVLRVTQVSRMSHVIQLETLQLPIGRSYLPLLRINYPHWFQ
ncbi:LytTR family DNA-binding domain-containing protein [Psychromonas hadalis]|uniref:LytTR family DNA-binding domain-containing protein n=1 Tax=Psychromonas hadalis TaxID=211669 RepID=UPI0003B46D01|nr:LytTR family DNA-binding domain-containing protein [Psychromonas hadalis]